MSDEELIAFATEFREGILEGRDSLGFCFAVSAPLVPLLAAHGVPCRLMVGYVCPTNHYWIELADGRILDPTADQFGGALPPVYLGKCPRFYADARPPEYAMLKL